MPIEILCSFLNWVVRGILFCCCCWVFTILDINPYQIMICKYFLQFCGLFFHSLIVSFDAQNLWWSSVQFIYFFLLVSCAFGACLVSFLIIMHSSFVGTIVSLSRKYINCVWLFLIYFLWFPALHLFSSFLSYMMEVFLKCLQSFCSYWYLKVRY